MEIKPTDMTFQSCQRLSQLYELLSPNNEQPPCQKTYLIWRLRCCILYGGCLLPMTLYLVILTTTRIVSFVTGMIVNLVV